jgi:hypothetical protein
MMGLLCGPGLRTSAYVCHSVSQHINTDDLRKHGVVDRGQQNRYSFLQNVGWLIGLTGEQVIESFDPFRKQIDTDAIGRPFRRPWTTHSERTTHARTHARTSPRSMQSSAEPMRQPD